LVTVLLKKSADRAIGLIEGCTPWRLRGWAVHFDEPLIAVELLLRVDGRDIRLFRPQMHMPALAKHLKWPESAVGLVAFDLALPRWVCDGEPHEIHVVFAGTGRVLQGGPQTVQHRAVHVAFEPAVTTPITPQDQKPNDEPLVTVVVLNRNGANVLDELFQSWEKFNKTLAAQWVVIDHASTDNSLAVLDRWQQRLPTTVQALNENRSFSESCNRAARLARTPFLLFLNNDIVWQQDALPVMLDTLRQADVCAVGLKLLKVSQLSNGQQWAEVQHLGVRFASHQECYLPYESTPLSGDTELEHAAQSVPAVTGAALLCRRDEFWAVGGFHESYFYGFEDVELCLRLAHHTQKRVVCRNDLLALHRHGYTRLTGREPSVLNRLQHNETVLCREIGLWLKRAWWDSLLTQDGGLCAERLQIGVYLGEKPTKVQRNRGNAMVQHIQQRYPNAKVWQISAGDDRYELRNLHVLLVAAPDYDVSLLQNARADLRVLACIHDKPEAWVDTPHWNLFDAYLATNSRLAKQLARLTPYTVDVPSEQDPLPNLQRYRIRIATSDHPRLKQRAQEWRDTMKTQGMACWVDGPSMTEPKTVEVKVWLSSQELVDAPDPACLNFWWRTQRHNTNSLPKAWDLTTTQAPTADQIRQALEEKIGHTFHTP
jgi:GT2 family glycosyltransferase